MFYFYLKFAFFSSKNILLVDFLDYLNVFCAVN
jgi:hypothetical protein